MKIFIWLLTLRRNQRLKVFVRSGIFRYKEEEIIWGKTA
jgi:hypothetical protein